MKTIKVHITDCNGVSLSASKALVWGNNAAWVCSSCGELLANRTGDSEYKVVCSCGAEYEIERTKSKSGSFHLGAAQGIKQKR